MDWADKRCPQSLVLYKMTSVDRPTQKPYGLHSPFSDPCALRVAARHAVTIGVGKHSAWAESRKFGIGTLELAGSVYADYQSLPDGTTSLDDLWAQRNRLFPNRVLSLGPFVDGDPSLPILDEWLKRRGLAWRITSLSQAPFLKITGSWREYCDAKRGKFWHNINRAEKQLVAGFGPLEFALARTPKEAAAVLPSCLALYRLNWTRLTSRSFFLTEPGGQLLRDLVAELAAEGKVEIATLTQGGQILAFSISLTMDSVYYFYVFATNKRPQYARYSVGKIFLRRLLESAFERGFQAFDFMAGEEPYKFEWTRKSRRRYAYYVVADTALDRARLSLLLGARQIEIALKNSRIVRGALRRISGLLPND